MVKKILSMSLLASCAMRSSAGDPAKCLAEMTKLCGKFEHKSGCQECIHGDKAHAALTPLCAGTGTGTKFCAPEAAAETHPTLPTMWTATVKEDEVGVVHESEHFVSRPDEQNPSAKWTNYTDGSCQRLIREGNNADRMRYLLGCESVQCCYEEGDGPIEYQIPNIHPAILAPVKYIGKETITLFDQSKVEADHWQWHFTIAQYNAYTTTAADGSGILHRWLVGAENQSFPNDYIDYKAVPADQQAAFLATFAVPDICSDSAGARSCDSLHKEGKLSDKSMKFLRSGKKSDRAPVLVV